MSIFKSFILGLALGVIGTIVWSFILFTDFYTSYKIGALILLAVLSFIGNRMLVKGDKLGKYRWERVSHNIPIPAYKHNAAFVGCIIPPAISFIAYEIVKI